MSSERVISSLKPPDGLKPGFYPSSLNILLSAISCQLLGISGKLKHRTSELKQIRNFISTCLIRYFNCIKVINIVYSKMQFTVTGLKFCDWGGLCVANRFKLLKFSIFQLVKKIGRLTIIKVIWRSTSIWSWWNIFTKWIAPFIMY